MNDARYQLYSNRKKETPGYILQVAELFIIIATLIIIIIIDMNIIIVLLILLFWACWAV